MRRGERKKQTITVIFTILTPHPRVHIIRRDYQSCSLGTHQSSPRLHRLVLPSFSVGFSDKPTVPGVALLIRPFLFPFLPFALYCRLGLVGHFLEVVFFPSSLLFFFSLLLSFFPWLPFHCGMTFVTREMGWNTIKKKANRSPSAKLLGSFFLANGWEKVTMRSVLVLAHMKKIRWKKKEQGRLKVPVQYFYFRISQPTNRPWQTNKACLTHA